MSILIVVNISRSATSIFLIVLETDEIQSLPSFMQVKMDYIHIYLNENEK